MISREGAFEVEEFEEWFEVSDPNGNSALAVRPENIGELIELLKELQANGIDDDGLVPFEVLPGRWERVIGRNSPDNLVTTFSSGTAWFDVSIWKMENDEFKVEVKRGPNHPHQQELDDPLREQSGVDKQHVEHVAIGFMLTASEIDPFTNTHSRGTRIGE